INAIEAPLYRREEMRATEIRRRMTVDENWEDLVPDPASKVIKEINGVERVKAIFRRDLSSHIT
ncbi:MAG: nicotinamide-nucleotide adenylyltransferase, partial [Thermoproteota archaeon]|nr:nicotinamide-nucleotide adenylyltransferase [Thermoproteota archaeon]